MKEIKKPETSDTDAEEIIKMLLEHIDSSGSNEQQEKQLQPIEECDLCITFQEAFERILSEKEQIVQVLNNIERENQDLVDSSHKTAKIIEKLEMQIQTYASNQQQFDEEQHTETSQKADASTQSDSSSN